MILSEKMRAGGMIMIVLFALSFVFFVGLSPAYAATASTTTIVTVPLNVSTDISMPTIRMDSIVPTAVVSATSSEGVTPAAVTVSSPTTVVSASTSGSCQAFLTSYIMPGQSNDVGQVDRLQIFLNAYEGTQLAINGTYDAPTMAAVEAFQQKYASDILAPWGVTAPTGDVYITTTREINEVYCGFSQTFPLTAAQQAVIAASYDDMSNMSASGPNGQSSATSASASQSATADEPEEAAVPAMSSSDASSASSSMASTSTSVTNNVFDSVGSFLKNIFH